MSFDEKEAVWVVAMRLRGEAIRCQHDAAEALIRKHWYKYQKASQKALELMFQSNTCLKVLST